MLQLDQGGLTLTSREQYLNKVFPIKPIYKEKLLKTTIVYWNDLRSVKSHVWSNPITLSQKYPKSHKFKKNVKMSVVASVWTMQIYSIWSYMVHRILKVFFKTISYRWILKLYSIKFPKTPDNDTVLAALLEVMVETSMMLFRWFFLILSNILRYNVLFHCEAQTVFSVHIIQPFNIELCAPPHIHIFCIFQKGSGCPKIRLKVQHVHICIFLTYHWLYALCTEKTLICRERKKTNLNVLYFKPYFWTPGTLLENAEYVNMWKGT